MWEASCVSTATSSATGARCSGAVVSRARGDGRCACASSPRIRSSVRSSICRRGECSSMRCGEASSEERGAGNLHATFCGSWRWVTAARPGHSEVMILRRRRKVATEAERYVYLPKNLETISPRETASRASLLLSWLTISFSAGDYEDFYHYRIRQTSQTMPPDTLATP
jgi:hypothetical protein